MKGRLAPRHWTEIEALWARGDHTLKQLSEKYGPRIETISSKMKERGVVKGRDEKKIKEEFETALEIKQRQFAEQRADSIVSTKGDLLKVIKSLTYGVAQIYAKAKEAGEPLGLHLNTIKAHREAIVAVKTGREEMYAILNYNPEEEALEELPELVVRGMTEKEIEEIRKSQLVSKTEEDEFAGLSKTEMPEFEEPDESGEPGDESD